MPVSTETAIAWFTARLGKVTYSMTRRDGPSSYDCSSSLYYALREAGASAASWAVTTESAHDWFVKNGFQLVAENKDWNMKRGDVVIWGRRGQSVGAGGHAMLAVDADRVIHCSYGYNGVHVDDYNQYYKWNAGTMGGPYVYVYRYTGGQPASQQPSVQHGGTSFKSGTIEQLAGEVMAGKYGSGDRRKAALGDKYQAVQTVINERLGAISASTSHKRLAEQVLQGRLGNGPDRKKNLGSYYQAVQNIINRR